MAKQSSRQFEELRHGQQRQMTALLAVVQKLEVLEEKIDDIPVAVRESRFQDWDVMDRKHWLCQLNIVCTVCLAASEFNG